MSLGKIKDLFLFGGKGPLLAPSLTEVKLVSEAALWTEKLLNHLHRTYRIKDDEVGSFMQGVVECFGEWYNAPKSIAVVTACCSVMRHSQNLEEAKWVLQGNLNIKGEEPFMWRGKTFVLDNPAQFPEINMMY